MTQRFWLLKSEPSTFGIEDLKKAKNQTTYWDGVRNYTARNLLRDQIQKGDLAFFYHSSCQIPAIVGVVEVVKAGTPDPSAFDPQSPYYDPSSSEDNPRWFGITVKLKQQLHVPISLAEMRENPELTAFRLLQKGNRLSVLPVSGKEWRAILAMQA